MDYIIHRFETVSSTNEVAITMAGQGAPEGTAIIAAEQTSGRGRHGRKWSSLRGGLYLSVILRPNRPPDEIYQLSFAGSLAVVDAIRKVTKLPAMIKWPNDILVSGKKVSGLLVEMRLPSVAIMGIGLNVNNTEFPAEIASLATSLALESGEQFDIRSFETSLLSALSDRYLQYLDEGFGSILAEWKRYDLITGKRVRVSIPTGFVEGVAVGIEPCGTLAVHSLDGKTHIINAGDVEFVRFE